MNRLSLGSNLLLSNALSMLNKNLTGFLQSLFSVQSICTVRKGSASRVTSHVTVEADVLSSLILYYD